MPGTNIFAASNVTCVGAGVAGEDVSNTTWIGNVFGVTTHSGTTLQVIVSDAGQLGTLPPQNGSKRTLHHGENQ